MRIQSIILKNKFFVNSNERTWRSLFWDPVIIEIVSIEYGTSEPVNFHLISIEKLDLVPDKETTRLDQVCQFKLDDLNIPILVIEYCSPDKFKGRNFL